MGGRSSTINDEAMKMVRLSGEVSEENAETIDSGKVLQNPKKQNTE